MQPRFIPWLMGLLIVVSAAVPYGAPADTGASSMESVFSNLRFRLIGPGFPSGRISDFAVFPNAQHRYFVATASGNLWLTDNDGTTWQAVDNGMGSYSYGVVEIDPNNSNVIWAGTGENNSQRSVAYGDGVYKSVDGGQSWTNMGLETSEHISQIVIDPRDSDRVFVASQGPLWNSGGERGLYLTEDGGHSWRRIHFVDADTGANELLQHPARPDHLLLSTYQRRRHVWTLINGGPGSGIYKSTDGGETFREITSGLPPHDMGRIGLAHSPAAPDIVYAIIETDDEFEGVYRSTDFGETWEKRSSYMATSPQYYNELVVDPKNPERVYSLDTFTAVSEDGGKNWKRLSLEARHVDDHALYIDPDNTEFLRIGGDGGIYESYDRGKTWRHINNLPIVQFYRIQPDNDTPFYNVYGGTQDNNTLGGPSRTPSIHGITNADWTIILGGDGYKAQIDPTNPDIVYAQYQYGGLARYDRRTGERVYIAPQPPSGEDEYRWNWNTPLLISPHDPSRLYYGAERLFRSDDRGQSWSAISGDLSRGLDRNRLKVMGRVWSVDTVAKNDSTSMYGSMIALSESPLVEGLIYVGTDDGLIQVTEDGGQQWRRVDTIAGVPHMSLVEDIIASQHDPDVAYAVFDNHKKGDFQPYVYRTDDRGKTWSSITGNLPTRGTAHTIAEDHLDPELLFVGTEFSVFATQNGGKEWGKLGSGLPTISVRDLEIQRRESDLVVGTFGRGIYILDDYSPLRTKASALTEGEAHLFDVKETHLYIPRSRIGSQPKGNMGAQYYTAENPPFGAIIRYYLSEGLESLREERRTRERAVQANGGDNPYPSWERLRREDREEAPSIALIVEDDEGRTLRRLEGPTGKGLHTVSWDLRLPAPDPVELGGNGFRAPWSSEPEGPLVTPGTYQVRLAKRIDGTLTELAGPVSVTLESLTFDSVLVAEDPDAVHAFQEETAKLYRAILGANQRLDEVAERMKALRVAYGRAPRADEPMRERLNGLQDRVDELAVAMRGDRTISRRNEAVAWSITQRVRSIVFGHWEARQPVTQTHREAYRIAAAEFTDALAALRDIDAELAQLEAEFEADLAPWTPERLPAEDSFSAPRPEAPAPAPEPPLGPPASASDSSEADAQG